MKNLEGNREESSVYELGFLILPSIPEDKLTAVTDSIRKVITEEGGTEIDSEMPFKEPLAYPMSKTVGASHYVLSDAYLGWIKFEAERAKSVAIRAGIEKIEAILRFLIVKAPRETTFTFAKARAAIAPTPEEVGVLTSPTESLEDVGKEVVI